MTIEFSQFVNGGTPQQGDIIVGLRGGLNTKFTYPLIVSTTWNLITSNVTMQANNGYVVNSMGSVTLAIPSTIALGQIFEVVMYGSGSFTVLCNTGQTIQVGNATTSSGGSLTSSAIGDAVKLLVCTPTQLLVLSGVTKDFTLV